jgi:hypothetical protein
MQHIRICLFYAACPCLHYTWTLTLTYSMDMDTQSEHGCTARPAAWTMAMHHDMYSTWSMDVDRQQGLRHGYASWIQTHAVWT